VRAPGFHEIASGEFGTFVLMGRSSGEPVMVNGAEVVPSSDEHDDGLIQLDHVGKAVNGRVFRSRNAHPPFVIGSADALVGVDSVSLGAKGAFATFPAGTTIPVDGNVFALTRTASGRVWVAGTHWGDDRGSQKCDRKSFLGRRNANGSVEMVACELVWRAFQLAAAGDDVVFCGSHFGGTVEIGDKKVTGKTFLARIGGDGTVRWVRAINEVGYSSCDDLVVTSDGDIVAGGTAVEDADFTPGAIAKGVKGKDDPGGGTLSALWLARYAGDGTRRWGRLIGETILGDHPSLAADRDGNAILVAAITGPLDLGHGPVGPDGAVMAATIDRDAKVRGMLVAHGGAYSARGAVDPANGLLFGFSTSDPVKVAGMTIQPPGKTPVAAVVRVPLPLPAP